MQVKNIKYDHEEVWNTISHALGFFFILLGGFYLIWTSFWVVSLGTAVAATFYIVGAVFVYAASTAYHAVKPGALKRQLQRIDHISIYFMIAGTHMPIIIRYFNDFDGYVFLAVMWTFVLIGTLYKIFWMGRFEVFGLLLYMVMSIMSIYLYPDLYLLMPNSIFALMVMGGFLYMVGLLFYCWEALPYNHVIWHLFVLGGSAAHFLVICSILSAN